MGNMIWIVLIALIAIQSNCFYLYLEGKRDPVLIEKEWFNHCDFNIKSIGNLHRKSIIQSKLNDEQYEALYQFIRKYKKPGWKSSIRSEQLHLIAKAMELANCKPPLLSEIFPYLFRLGNNMDLFDSSFFNIHRQELCRYVPYSLAIDSAKISHESLLLALLTHCKKETLAVIEGTGDLEKFSQSALQAFKKIYNAVTVEVGYETAKFGNWNVIFKTLVEKDRALARSILEDVENDTISTLNISELISTACSGLDMTLFQLLHDHIYYGSYENPKIFFDFKCFRYAIEKNSQDVLSRLLFLQQEKGNLLNEQMINENILIVAVSKPNGMQSLLLITDYMVSTPSVHFASTSHVTDALDACKVINDPIRYLMIKLADEKRKLRVHVDTQLKAIQKSSIPLH